MPLGTSSPIILVEDAPEERQISLTDTETPSTVIASEDLEQNVNKAHFALGSNSPGIQFLSADFHANLEQETRRLAVTKQALQQRAVKHQIVQELIQEFAEAGTELPMAVRDLIMGLSEEEMENPETILEKLYAEKLVQSSVVNSPGGEDPLLDEALMENEEKAHQVMDEAAHLITNQELALRNLQKTKELHDNTSWSQWGIDLAESIIWFRTHSRVAGAIDIPRTKTLTGASISEQIANWYRLPPEQAKPLLDEAMNELRERNILDAVKFASALVHYGTEEERMDDITFGLDAADLATLGVAVGGTALIRLGRRLSAVRKANRLDTKPEDILAASGNLQDAAVESAGRRLAHGAGESAVLKRISDLGKAVPSILDANLIARNIGSLSQEQARRIVDHVTSSKNRLNAIITDASVLQRYGTSAQARMFSKERQRFLNEYPKLEDSIVDIVPVPEAERIFAGVDRIDVLLGRRDATSFKRPEEAKWFAENMYRLPEGGYDPVLIDGNWFVRIRRYVREDDLEIRDLRVMTNAPDTQTAIRGFMNALGRGLSTWASPDDILPGDHRSARKIATFGGNIVNRMFQQAARTIGKMPKGSRQDLERVLNRNHYEMRQVTQPDGTVESVRGNWYETIGELQHGWKKVTGRLPNDQETRAYFEFRNIMDFQWKFSNLAVAKDKQRLGINEKSVQFVQKNAQGQDQYMSSPFFEGRTIDALPHWGRKPFTVGWVDEKTGQMHFGVSNKLFPRQRQEIERLVASGKYKIIQTLEGGGDLRQAMNSRGEPVEYVLARNVSERELSPIQVPYRPGGHRIHASHGAYLKQPNVTFTGFGRAVRNGDTTAHWDPSAVQMERFRDLYEEGRQMLLRGASNEELDLFIRDRFPLFKSATDFRNIFRGLKGSPEDAPFDVRSPFVVVRPGQSTTDLLDLPGVYGMEFIDQGVSEHNLRNLMYSAYTQERGELLTRIRELGTEANPVFKTEPAQILEPLDALARSSQQILRSRYYDDYRQMAVENWTHQWGKLLAGSAEEIRANPMKNLVNPQWLPSSAISDPTELVLARAQRRAILQLMGAEQDSMGAVNNVIQNIADGVARRAGRSTEELVDAWRWTDPKLSFGQWARSMAFHAYFSFYNPLQFFLQGSAVAISAAITGNPVRATRGVLMYMMQRRLLMSAENKAGPALQATARALGVREDWMQEAYDLYRRAGMHEFMGEHGGLDLYFKAPILRSGAHKALDGSNLFFREGNLVPRGSGFNMAYLEFRQRNPNKKITDRDLQWIVNRADDLSVNQTRASINPIYEQGALKFPTQFFTFFSRLSDQLLGTRLTAAERVRTMMVLSALFGIPTGVFGAALGRFWPFYDHFREEAISQGWDPQHDHPVLRAFLEGALPIAIEQWVGEDFDVTGRWGPGGLPWLRELTRGDSSAFEVITGASGTFLGETISTFEPFTMYLAELFSPSDAETPSFQLTPDDYVSVLRNITSINQAYGVYAAIQYQKVFTKSGRPVADTDVQRALVTALTGWQQQEVADSWRMLSDMRQWRQYKNRVTGLALDEYRKGLFAAAEQNDPERAEVFFNRARAYLEASGLDAIEMSEVFERAIRENRDLVDVLGPQYILRGPMDRRQRRHDREYRKLEESYGTQETE